MPVHVTIQMRKKWIIVIVLQIKKFLQENDDTNKSCDPTPLLNKCKNYCAIDNHCVDTPAPKELNSDDYSAFFQQHVLT